MSSSQSRTSDLKTADALIFTGRCALCGILINPVASATATVVVHDGLSATGKVLAKAIIISGAAPTPVHIDFTRPVTAEVGIFVDITQVTDYVVYHS